MHDEDTLGIQGILALVILYQTNPDSRRAHVLIGTAVLRVLQLQLYTRSSHIHFAPNEARQRDNVFWICYLLEKYLSSRNKVPSILRDDDVDIDLPAVDGDGVLVSEDGLSRFNYFRARVQLAHLQGRIFDILYNVRSKRLTPEDRQEHVTKLDMLLEKWHRTIPTSLQVEHMAQSLTRVPVAHMTILQHLYLLTLVLLHGLYSLDSGWMKAIGVYGQTVLANLDNNTDICMRHMQPPIPSAWVRCMSAARGSIRLSLSAPQDTCTFWLNMGAYFSGIIILLANCQYYPTNELARQDLKLAQDGTKLLAELTHLNQDDQLNQMMSVLNNLEAIASRSIDHYQSHPDAPPQPPLLAQEIYSISEDFGDDILHGLSTDIDASTAETFPLWENGFEPDFHPSDLGSAKGALFDSRFNDLLTDDSIQDIF
ncbi:putative Fungal-specific transcription factor domain-containing protein [Seiridium cardinale]|uniref:Fungal-specific transcription factor domain-containing protein n=1 Tax=Seiridium cardinale TaxID=138064 RepID=A0ABR2Y7T4_9PEZI